MTDQRPLRILHVIWWGEIGGIALNLVDLARHCRARNHIMEVCVLTRSSPLIDALADRRRAREPVARILGVKEFWGLALRLNAETLVPRPETETLVEAALAAAGNHGDADAAALTASVEVVHGLYVDVAVLVTPLSFHRLLRNELAVGADEGYERVVLATKLLDNTERMVNRVVVVTGLDVGNQQQLLLSGPGISVGAPSSGSKLGGWCLRLRRRPSPPRRLPAASATLGHLTSSRCWRLSSQRVG